MSVVRGMSDSWSFSVCRTIASCAAVIVRERNRAGSASFGYASRRNAAPKHSIARCAAISPCRCPPRPSATAMSSAPGDSQWPTRSSLMRRMPRRLSCTMENFMTAGPSAARTRSAAGRRDAAAGTSPPFRAARNGGLVPTAASRRPAAERVRAAEGPAVMKFSIVHDSRRGMRRINEDRVGHWESPGALLMAVADGLGGHLHGEIAAHLAIEYLGEAFLREARPRLADRARFLSRTMAAAHEAIVRQTEKLQLSYMPRTTLIACVVQDGYAYWSNVGDCRLYLLREGRVLARTRDDTMVQQLVDEGRIREEAIASHPERNRLLQTLGGYQAPRPAGASARLAKNDVLLLCSDGFWGPLTQRQLVHGFIANPLGQAIPDLMALAEMRAGDESDNLSVVALAWCEDEVAVADAPQTVPQREPATDVQDFTATDLDFLRMSDEDIERAIAEIKAALRKNAPR